MAAPLAPVLLTPTNGATGQPLSLTLTWDVSVGADTYNYELSGFSDMSHPFWSGNTTDTFVNFIASNYNLTIYWRVYATNVDGDSPWSSIWSFTTALPAVSTYYINAGSAVEDGLTPATGYHSLYNLGAVSSGRVFANGDVIEIVDNGVVDDTLGRLQFQTGLEITIKSYSGNTNKPQWRIKNYSGGHGATYAGVGFGSFTTITLPLQPIHLYDLDIIGKVDVAPNSSTIAMTGGGGFTGSGDIDIQRCKFTSTIFTIIYADSVNVKNCIWKDSKNPSLSISSISSGATTLPIYINNNDFYTLNPSISAIKIINAPMDTARILNNVFQTTGYGVDLDGLSTAIDFQIKNNIDYGTLTTYTAEALAYCSDNINNTDPLLTDPVNDDFTLQSSSPCLNAGIDNSTDLTVPTDDFIGTSRPQDIHTCIGAYENTATPPPPPSTSSELIIEGTGTLFVNGDFILQSGTCNTNGLNIQVGI